MNEHDKKEIEKLKEVKRQYLLDKNLSKEEKIRRFLAAMRG